MDITERLRIEPLDDMFLDTYESILTHSIKTTLMSLLLSKSFFISVHDQIREINSRASYKTIDEICKKNGVENHIITNAAFYHDIGKLDPTIFKIISNKRKLTKKEMDIVKKHPIKSIEKFKDALILDDGLSYDGEIVSFSNGSYFSIGLGEFAIYEKLEKSKTFISFIQDFVEFNKENIKELNYLKMEKPEIKTLGDQKQSDYLQIEDIIKHHHERNDGSGYPDGLIDDGLGETISIGTQIVSLADTYCALTENRKHQKKKNHNEAMEVIYSLKNVNPGLVEILDVYGNPKNWVQGGKVPPGNSLYLEGWPRHINAFDIIKYLFPYMNKKSEKKMGKLLSLVPGY